MLIIPKITAPFFLRENNLTEVIKTKKLLSDKINFHKKIKEDYSIYKKYNK